MLAGHDHASCVNEALDAADRICAARGARLTPLRRRVLELVWSSHRAVKAYDLLATLGGDGPPVKPPTVYRTLDFLVAQGLVHRVDSLNAFVGCVHPDLAHAGYLLICSRCGNVQEVDDERATGPIASALERAATAAGFRIESETVELHGVCAACAAA